MTLGHRISAINDYARVNNPPNECPSADSCPGSGDESDSPRTRRDSKNQLRFQMMKGSHLMQWPVQVENSIKLLLLKIM